MQKLGSPVAVSITVDMPFNKQLYYSKLRGRLQTMLTRRSDRAGSGKLLTFWLTIIMWNVSKSMQGVGGQKKPNTSQRSF